MKIIKVTAMVAALLLAASMTSFAAEPRGLKIELTPYLWLIGIDGDITVNDRKVDFDRSFSDVFDNMEIGGSLLGVVQYNRFLFWGQVDYLSVSDDDLDVTDRVLGGKLDAKLDSKMLLMEAAVGYQIDGWMDGMTVDFLAGVRVLQIENDLDVYGRTKSTFSKDKDIVDPILVMRPSIPLFPSSIKGLRFNPTMAIGGGGDSDLVYELFPQVQYQFTENIAARLGYRIVGYKFDDDDNELNFELNGMIIGLGVLF